MKKIFIYIVIVSIVASCQDVFEELPADKYVGSVVWNEAGPADLFINEVYNGLPNSVEGIWGPDSNTPDFYSHHNWAAEQLIPRGQLTPQNSQSWGVLYNKGGDNASGLWGYMYKKIRACNTVLAQLDVEDEDFIKTRTGEILTLRAIYYSRLALAFGNVILVGDDLMDLDSDFMSMSQSPFLEVMDYINSELDRAIELLPDDQAQRGRINRYTAMAYKAEFLLIAASPRYNGGTYNTTLLQEAGEVNDEIISSGRYSLMPDFGDATRLMQGNSEVIFARYISADRHIDRDNDTDRDLAPGGAGGFTTYNPTQTLVDQFEVIDGTTSFIPATWNNNVRTVTSNPAYSDNDMYSNRDARFYETVFYNGGMRNPDYVIETYVGGKDSRECTGCQYWNNGYFGYYTAKKIDPSVNVYADNSLNEDMTTYHRLGGVMLNQAEILFQLGNGAGALDLVNQIRARAGVPQYTSIDMDKIKHETVVELIAEGKRYNNLRRWDDLKEYGKNSQWGIKFTPNGDGTFTQEMIEVVPANWDDKYYWVPIPQVEMNKNPNLVQAPRY